jgi:hypothetical protein
VKTIHNNKKSPALIAELPVNILFAENYPCLSASILISTIEPMKNAKNNTHVMIVMVIICLDFIDIKITTTVPKCKCFSK